MRAYGCLILLFTLTTAFARGNKTIISCQDVTKIDFENVTISAGKLIFAFRDAIALAYEMPEIEKSGPPDWKAEIQRDTVVHPASGTTVRFLLIYDSHLTGSGWNYWLVGYKCSDGHLQQVFSREGLSFRVERLEDSVVVVSKLQTHGSLIRTPWSYVWDHHLRQFGA